VFGHSGCKLCSATFIRTDYVFYIKIKTFIFMYLFNFVTPIRRWAQNIVVHVFLSPTHLGLVAQLGECAPFFYPAFRLLHLAKISIVLGTLRSTISSLRLCRLSTCFILGSRLLFCVFPLEYMIGNNAPFACLCPEVFVYSPAVFLHRDKLHMLARLVLFSCTDNPFSLYGMFNYNFNFKW
jgi:hypothetical protein